MSATVKEAAHGGGQSVEALMLDIGARAREAAAVLGMARREAKDLALRGGARAIRQRAGDIMTANAADLADMEGKASAAFIDRATSTMGVSDLTAPNSLIAPVTTIRSSSVCCCTSSVVCVSWASAGAETASASVAVVVARIALIDESLMSII